MGTRFRQAWIAGVLVIVGAVVAYLVWSREEAPGGDLPKPAFDRGVRTHLDHTPFFPDAIETPQDVTRRCLSCHSDAAAEVMRTAHWQWLGREVAVPGHEGMRRIGKANLLNNFCLSTIGNRANCTKCHAGYGWEADPYDFSRSENVDCLVCHEWSGVYVKGDAGLPAQGTDLAAVARSVGFPKRENCSVCHSYGGGGQGVKHGDLDSSLDNPGPEDDVHMGREAFLCVDCHAAPNHDIRGRAFSVSVDNDNNVACEDCHTKPPHQDQRINGHLDALSCQACHIPAYARKLPTKTFWDWSKGGDPSRQDDPHHYLRIKGEFVYNHDMQPQYFWFDKSVDRYLLDDPIDPDAVTAINRPRGNIHNPAARIWPFRIHRALQPYDTRRNVLLPPILSGEGGYWHEFDWPKALSLGAKAAGMAFSGEFGFANTAMYWPLSHMVMPRENTLRCTDCHGDGGRMDWKALGYEGDPVVTGGRR